MLIPGSESGYASWANCGLGSTVTTEDVKEIAPGMRITSTTSLTLCALDAHKATLDMVVRNRVEGGPVDFPPTETLQEVEIPAEPGPPGEPEHSIVSESNEDGTWGTAEVSVVPWPAADQDPMRQEGEETLVVAGQEVACR